VLKISGLESEALILGENASVSGVKVLLDK
jgi:hypothetical protein